MKAAIKILIMALAACGCRRNADPISFAEEESNGLKKKVTVGNTIYEIQYKPAAYIVRMEHLDPAEEQQRLKTLEGTIWMNITFRIDSFNQSPLRYNISGLEEYTAKQDYFLNDAPKDMYLLYGHDTLHVYSYWFENSQNLLPHETMVVGFKLPGDASVPKEDLRFAFYDRVNHNGIIKTVIAREDIENAPGL